MSFTVRIWLDRVCLPVSAIPKQATLSKSGPVQPLTQTRPCPCLQFSNRQLHLNRAATEYKTRPDRKHVRIVPPHPVVTNFVIKRSLRVPHALYNQPNPTNQFHHHLTPSAHPPYRFPSQFPSSCSTSSFPSVLRTLNITQSFSV
jgi:hypothetical protein